jgi:hypothetical protein
MINVAAFVSDKQKAGTPFEGRWVSEVSHEEIEKAYQDFEPAAKSLLKVSLRAGLNMRFPPTWIYCSASKTLRDGHFT